MENVARPPDTQKSRRNLSTFAIRSQWIFIPILILFGSPQVFIRVFLGSSVSKTPSRGTAGIPSIWSTCFTPSYLSLLASLSVRFLSLVSECTMLYAYYTQYSICYLISPRGNKKKKYILQLIKRRIQQYTIFLVDNLF